MIKKTILVTGCNGFIGTSFIDKYWRKYDLTGLSRSKLSPKMTFPLGIKIISADITDKETINRIINSVKPDSILHIAAKAHIDVCEKDRSSGTKGEVWKINVKGTENLVQACRKYNKHLFYLSTECVFDGREGNYKETDVPKPINWYGKTKLEGEIIIRQSGIRYTILRSVLAYGSKVTFPTDLFRIFHNHLKRGRNIQAVTNQDYNFTFINDLIDTISLLMDRGASGLYHYGGDAIISPFVMARQIKDYFNFNKCSIRPVSLKRFFGEKAKYRLPHSTLNCNKIKRDFGINLSSFKAALSSIKNYY